MTNLEVNMRAWQIVANDFCNFLPVLLLLICFCLLLGAMSMGLTGRGSHRARKVEKKIDVYAHLK
jgi:hypothetical protein